MPLMPDSPAVRYFHLTGCLVTRTLTTAPTADYRALLARLIRDAGDPPGRTLLAFCLLARGTGTSSVGPREPTGSRSPD